MDGGTNDTPIFRSDDIATAHSTKNKNNYFVRVTKNPILRFILRQKKIEEEKPKEAPKPVVVAPKKPKPQFRVTIRVSIQKLENEKKRNRKIITILSLIIVLLSAATVFFALYSNPLFGQPAETSTSTLSESEVVELRKQLYDIVKTAPLSLDTIESTLGKMDSVINLVPEGESRQSLKLYKVSLLTSSGYNAEALQYFEEIENEDFSDDQRCELYGYRLEISKKSPNLDSNASYQEKYNTLCVAQN